MKALVELSHLSENVNQPLENQNSFLVGLTQKGNNSELVKVIYDELNKNIRGTYCGELVAKYKDEYPIWAFIEIIPFGRFIKFYMIVT